METVSHNENSIIEKKGRGRPKGRKPLVPRKCDICNISFICYQHEITHLQSKKHLKKLEQINNPDQPKIIKQKLDPALKKQRIHEQSIKSQNKNRLIRKCDVCHTSFACASHESLHLQSKKHARIWHLIHNPPATDVQ
jgi:hypothetical protein